jgi:hypothetical protein
MKEFSLHFIIKLGDPAGEVAALKVAMSSSVSDHEKMSMSSARCLVEEAFVVKGMPCW